MLVLGGLAWGVRGSAALILAASLFYGFLPSALAFQEGLRRRRHAADAAGVRVASG